MTTIVARVLCVLAVAFAVTRDTGVASACDSGEPSDVFTLSDRASAAIVVSASTDRAGVVERALWGKAPSSIVLGHSDCDPILLPGERSLLFLSETGHPLGTSEGAVLLVGAQGEAMVSTVMAWHQGRERDLERIAASELGTPWVRTANTPHGLPSFSRLYVDASYRLRATSELTSVQVHETRPNLFMRASEAARVAIVQAGPNELLVVSELIGKGPTRLARDPGLALVPGATYLACLDHGEQASDRLGDYTLLAGDLDRGRVPKMLALLLSASTPASRTAALSELALGLGTLFPAESTRSLSERLTVDFWDYLSSKPKAFRHLTRAACAAMRKASDTTCCRATEDLEHKERALLNACGR